MALGAGRGAPTAMSGAYDVQVGGPGTRDTRELPQDLDDTAGSLHSAISGLGAPHRTGLHLGHPSKRGCGIRKNPLWYVNY